MIVKCFKIKSLSQQKLRCPSAYKDFYPGVKLNHQEKGFDKGTFDQYQKYITDVTSRPRDLGMFPRQLETRNSFWLRKRDSTIKAWGEEGMELDLDLDLDLDLAMKANIYWNTS